MVESLTVPSAINTQPTGTFVVYATDGKTEIWRENVKLNKYTDDDQLRAVLNAWANPYITRYERKIALQTLAGSSAIVGVKLDHLTAD